MKKGILAILIGLFIVFPKITVQAEEASIVQEVMEEIQQEQKSKTEEMSEITRDLKDLTVNELEEMEQYLSDKQGLSSQEDLLLTTTRSLLDGETVDIEDPEEIEIEGTILGMSLEDFSTVALIAIIAGLVVAGYGTRISSEDVEVFGYFIVCLGFFGLVTTLITILN